MNKFKHSTFLTLLPVLLSTYLISCGSGSSSKDVAGIDGSGAPVTSTSGTINGFGSVIVNGVRYHSDKANIMIDGQRLTEDSLRTGYQVNVIGTLNSDGTGTATSIVFRADLVGKISQIDLHDEQIILLGQTVKITGSTIFDAAIKPNDLEGLSINDVILVSGQIDSDHTIIATRIELAPLQSQQLTGVINNLNETTFTYNNVTINYSAATLNEFDNSPLKNGLSVSVVGSLNANGIFQATLITRIKTSFSSDVKNADIEGLITRFVSISDFDVAGKSCSTNDQTFYKDGSSTNLMLGASLKLKGAVNSSGILIAQKIEYQQKNTNEIAGEVSSITTDVMGAIATGSFQMNGITFQTTTSTEYEDRSDEHLKRFNFSDIQVGNFLKISGYENQAVFIASKIERKKIDKDAELKFDGLITQIELHSFIIYDRTVFIDDETIIRAAKNEIITEEELIAQALNRRVLVKAVMKGGVLTATEIRMKKAKKK